MNNLVDIVLYVRVSSEGERQNNERQINSLTQYATSNNFNIKNIFEEKMSGGKGNRPVLNECIDYCIKNKISTLAVNSIDRIGRHTLNVLSTLEKLHENKINVYIQQLGLNTLNEDKTINPCAAILTTVMSQMASIERENIKYRLNSGRENYINKGGALGRSKGSVKTSEQKKVEYSEAISLLKKGYSVRNVAKITGRGVATIQRVKSEFDL